MPRRARRELETSFFHVIVQGIEKKFIFNKKEYIERYLDLLFYVPVGRHIGNAHVGPVRKEDGDVIKY